MNNFWKFYVLAIALVTVVSLTTVVFSFSKPTENLATSNQEGRILITFPLTLNTVQYAQNVINGSLSLPSTTFLGSAYQVVGVRINQAPTKVVYVGADGASKSFIRWSVTIFLWDKTFVNGTTTNRDILDGGGVGIIVTSVPLEANSALAARALMDPPVVCQSNAGGSVCQTYTSSSDRYMLNYKGLALVVSPQGGDVQWVDDRAHRSIEIGSDTVGSAQLLALAETMMP